MNEILLATALVNCITATNMVICDNGTTIYNHGSQSTIYNQHGDIAEVYRQYKQMDIYPALPQPTTRQPTYDYDLPSLVLEPIN